MAVSGTWSGGNGETEAQGGVAAAAAAAPQAAGVGE